MMCSKSTPAAITTTVLDLIVNTHDGDSEGEDQDSAAIWITEEEVPDEQDEEEERQNVALSNLQAWN